MTHLPLAQTGIAAEATASPLTPGKNVAPRTSKGDTADRPHDDRAGQRRARQSGGRTLDLAALASELGRSPDWLYANWRQLVARDGLPPPIFTTGHLTWSALQVWAWLDRRLPAHLRRRVEALRLAEATLAEDWQTAGASAHEIDRWRTHLDSITTLDTMTGDE